MFTMSLIFAIQYIIGNMAATSDNTGSYALRLLQATCCVFMGCLGMQSATYVFNTVCIIGVLYAMQYVAGFMQLSHDIGQVKLVKNAAFMIDSFANPLFSSEEMITASHGMT
jgi:hypothetical protein